MQALVRFRGDRSKIAREDIRPHCKEAEWWHRPRRPKSGILKAPHGPDRDGGGREDELGVGCWCGVEEEEAPEQSIPVEVSHGHIAKQVHSFRWLTLVTYVAPS